MAETAETKSTWEGGGWQGIDIRKPTHTSQWNSVSREIDSRWKKLLSNPRVIKKSEIVAGGEGIVARGVDAEKMGLASFVTFFEDFPGGTQGLRHGHMNEAVFYILKGRGYEIHDGEKYEWEAGDIVIVPNGAVHTHLNADPVESAQALVVNPKPLFLAMNLLAQRLIHLPEEVERVD